MSRRLGSSACASATAGLARYERNPWILPPAGSVMPAIPFPDIGAIWEKDWAGALALHMLEALRLESREIDTAAPPMPA